MSEKYKIWDNNKAYFLTMTITSWIDLFTRPEYKFVVIDSLKYCQDKKGLTVFGYCLMTSHLHLLARADGEFSLSEILRDMKKHTSKQLVKKIEEEPESRREWMLEVFRKAAIQYKGKVRYKIWQEGNHPEEVSSNRFFDEKIKYIHYNPVKEQIVDRPEDYLFSSARNYAGLPNYLDIVLESVKMERYR